MRVFGMAQGRNQSIFSRLVLATAAEANWESVGAFVADASYFSQSDDMRLLEAAYDPVYLKEWETLAQAKTATPDLKRIAQAEELLGPPSLWAALLADRRVFFGPYCKVRQDYAPRHDRKRLLAILSAALMRVEAVLDEARPDIILGFVPVTLHEILLLRFAQARGIRTLLLRSTKIENYIAFNDRLFGLSEHIAQHYHSRSAGAAARATAQRYIAQTRADGARYEGMHAASHAQRAFKPVAAGRAIAGNAFAELRRRRDRLTSTDPHNANEFLSSVEREIGQPWRAYRTRRFMHRSGRLVDPRAASLLTKFALYPLHFEPEIALQIFARPLQNQIEVVRTLALSLPAGMQLVVKEHPRAVGFRPLGYYRKLLEIPNVLLADAATPSVSYLRYASLVAVITGNIGLEAVTLRKPVIVLGETDISELPDVMVRTCHNPYELSAQIFDLLKTHRHDEAALEAFLAAFVEGGVPVDLYSTLLGKDARLRFGEGDHQGDFLKLTGYLLERMRARTVEVAA